MGGRIMLKVPRYQRKATKKYEERNGYIQYNRRIKPEWKKILEELLTRLRKEGI